MGPSNTAEQHTDFELPSNTSCCEPAELQPAEFELGHASGSSDGKLGVQQVEQLEYCGTVNGRQPWHLDNTIALLALLHSWVCSLKDAPSSRIEVTRVVICPAAGPLRMALSTTGRGMKYAR